VTPRAHHTPVGNPLNLDRMVDEMVGSTTVRRC